MFTWESWPDATATAPSAAGVWLLALLLGSACAAAAAVGLCVELLALAWAEAGWPPDGPLVGGARGVGGCGCGAAAVLARLVPALLLVASEAMRKRASSPTHETRQATGKDRHIKAKEM